MHLDSGIQRTEAHRFYEREGMTMAGLHADAFFHIISKDSGFDPLIKHLKGKKIFAHRSICIADIPYFKPVSPTVPEDQIELAVADLVRRKASKPRTQKTLLSTLHALFRKNSPTNSLHSCSPRCAIAVS